MAFHGALLAGTSISFKGAAGFHGGIFVLAEAGRALVCVDGDDKTIKSTPIEIPITAEDIVSVSVTWVQLASLRNLVPGCSTPSVSAILAHRIAIAMENMTPEIYESPAEEDTATSEVRQLREEIATMRAMLRATAGQYPGQTMGSTSRARDRGRAATGQSAASGYGKSGLEKESLNGMKGLAAAQAAWAGTTAEESDDSEAADGAGEGSDEQDDAIDIEAFLKAGARAKKKFGADATLEDMMKKALLEMMEKGKKKKSKKKQKKKKKKKKGGSSDEDSSSSSDTSSSSQEDGQDGNRGGLEGIMSLRRDYRKHPERFPGPYVKRCREITGITSDVQQFQLPDFSKRIRRQFGRMVGLWRCHLGLQQGIQLLLDKDGPHGVAFLIQLSKAVHQVALDNGSWENAQHLLPCPDSLEDPTFGGLEHEMLRVQRYRKATKELVMTTICPDAKSSADDYGKSTKQKAKGKGKGDNEKEE